MRTTWWPALSRSVLAVVIAAVVGCVSNPTPHPGSSDPSSLGQGDSNPPAHPGGSDPATAGLDDDGNPDPMMGGGSEANDSAADAMGEPAEADTDAGASDSEGGDTAGPVDAAAGGG